MKKLLEENETLTQIVKEQIIFQHKWMFPYHLKVTMWHISVKVSKKTTKKHCVWGWSKSVN